MKSARSNVMIRRGCLIAELVVITLYEHVPTQAKIFLLFVAVVAGITATVAFLCEPSTESSQPTTAVDAASEATRIAYEVSTESLRYLDGIRIPPAYREQWSAIVFQAKSLKPNNLHPYAKLIDLGQTSEWKSPELSEVMKAVTSLNRRFTVELTNSDSILIHCEPISKDTKPSPIIVGALVASVPELVVH